MSFKEFSKKLRAHEPADVFGTDYTCGQEPITPSLDCFNPIFCDNVILWSLKKDYRADIQKICKKFFGENFEIRLLRSGTLKDDDIAPCGITYKSYKISLTGIPLEKVIISLEKIVSDDIILHDIDITQDIPCITTRQIVRDYVLKNGIYREDVVDDRRKVGDNCISFYNPDHSLRIKVYNKFVQMLESCDVMTTLGSRIHAMFVDPSEYIKKILDKTKYTGITRVEVKFYGTHIHPVEYYINNFNMIKKNLEGCEFFDVSLRNQWEQLVKNIYHKQVVMIYIEDKRLFAYCHWWNSQTGKMQGGSQKM